MQEVFNVTNPFGLLADIVDELCCPRINPAIGSVIECYAVTEDAQPFYASLLWKLSWIAPHRKFLKPLPKPPK